MTINDLERLRDVSEENQSFELYRLLANIFLLFDNNPPPLIEQYIREILCLLDCDLLESVKRAGKASGALPTKYGDSPTGDRP